MERDIPHTIVEDLERSSSLPPPRLDPARADFANAVLEGFATKPRSLPCRFFYDARGSALFEEITQLEEYYPTRAETALLEAYGDEIAERMGDARVLVEPHLAELAAVVDGCSGLNGERFSVVADLRIARGLDYYTGTVFETRMTGFEGLG